MLVILQPFSSRSGGGRLAHRERMFMGLTGGIREAPREECRCLFISYVLGALSGQVLCWVLGNSWELWPLHPHGAHGLEGIVTEQSLPQWGGCASKEDIQGAWGG